MDHVLGALAVVLLFYPFWSPRCRRIRRTMREGVSGNTSLDVTMQLVASPKPKIKSGPKWEQDELMSEVFEGDDDL